MMTCPFPTVVPPLPVVPENRTNRVRPGWLAAITPTAFRLLSQCDDTGCGKTYPGDLDKCPHCGASAAFSKPAPVDPRDWGWDIETFPNIATFLFIHAETGQERLFEISDRRNEWEGLRDFVRFLHDGRARGIGFNSIGFDYEVLHATITQGLTTAEAIYAKAMSIINNPDRFGGFKVWESDWLFEQIDLYKVWHFDNRNKQTSLKALEIAMRSERVSDMPVELGTMLGDQQKDVLINYNRDDVHETLKFYARSLQQIKLREALSERYGVNMLNYSNTKIGSTILIQAMEAGGIQCFERIGGRKTPRQTHRAVVRLGDVIFPYVRFERPEFQQIVDIYKAKTLRADELDESQLKTKGVFVDLEAVVDSFTFVFGVGGIHGSVSSQVVCADDENPMVDIDVTSFYPKMAIVNNMYPAHFGPQFCTTYNQIFEQRKTFPKGSPENAALKEVLNASYGNSNNKYSPLYDPFYTMQTTINGQLLLCMLAEQLMKIPGLMMVQVNTDGVTVRCPRQYLDHMRAVCKWWEGLTCLQLEEVLYSRMWIRDCNNYIAEYEGGKVKRKGAYEYEKQWHQDPSSPIVAMAAEAALVRGECLASYIVNHTDPFDFMLRAKVPKSSRLVLRQGGEERDLQKTTRYFVSMNGGKMVNIMAPKEPEGTWKRKSKVPDRVYNSVMQEIKGWPGDLDAAGTPWDARIHTGNKSKHTKRETSICSGFLVTECADARDFDWSDIDYGYYVAEASKLVDPLVKGA